MIAFLTLVAQQAQTAEGVFIDQWLVVLILGTFFSALLASGGWAVRLLWRTSTNLGRIEERLDDMERRIDSAGL